MFLVFVFSWCFTPHFNPIELRFICGSPILSNHCLFVRTLGLSGTTRANRRLCLGDGASKMLKHRKIGDANASRLSHLPTELAKKISNSLGDLGERATEVPGLMLYRRTAPTVPNPSTYEPRPSCHCARKLFVSAPSERRLSWPRRRRAPPLPPDFCSTR